MEQAALTKDVPGNVPPVPAVAPPQIQPVDSHENTADLPPFPDASGSLSSILASLGENEEERTTPPSTPDGAQQTGKRNKHAKTSPKKEDDNPYPDIMLMPLPRQDALRIKWGLGNGLPNIATLSAEELSRLAVGSTISDRKNSSLRLFGMLPSGEPWETRLTYDELTNSPHGILIGRDPSECGIVISEDSVSRRHALLEMTADGLAISDLDSRNGTIVDERHLSRYDHRVPLNDGSTINLGEVTIRVEILQ